jgi:hypothetical protein
MYEIHARTRPSLTPRFFAYARAYRASTPADGGGSVGGFCLGPVTDAALPASFSHFVVAGAHSPSLGSGLFRGTDSRKQLARAVRLDMRQSARAAAAMACSQCNGEVRGVYVAVSDWCRHWYPFSNLYIVRSRRREMRPSGVGPQRTRRSG